ncbi:MAG: glycosyltransferase [Candidatus Pacebacteria bacterium]|nr:glycosyltransferase [Candidatus Paceibacterota bacterium]
MKKTVLLHLFAPLRFGGGETFLANFLHGSTSSFDNKVILFSSSPELFAEVGGSGSVATVTRFLNSDMGTGKKSSYIRLFLQILLHPFKMSRVFRANGDYDFVIGHGFPFNFILPLLRGAGVVKARGGMVYFQHHRLMNSSGSALQRVIYQKLFSFFDIIIANSPDVRDDILALDKGLSSKIIIYSVGLDFEYIKERAMGVSGIKPSIPRGGIVAIYPARFMPHKNHRLFTRIFAKLKEAGVIERFFVVFSAGDNELKKAFQEKIVGEGYQKNCLFPERLGHDDLLRTMRSADICIFPSLEEGFGLGILEALIMEVPVVALRGAIPTELAAFTLSAESEDEFTDIACRLVEDPAYLAKAAESLKDNYASLRKMSDLRETSPKLRDALVAFSSGSGVIAEE